MKSSLSKEEFRSRLTERVAPEKVAFIFFPYDFSGKSFCGKFDDHSFSLTRNSFFIHVKLFMIVGEYKEVANQSSDVDYAIGWSSFSRMAHFMIAALVLIGSNTVLILLRGKMELPFASVTLAVNATFLAVCLLALLFYKLAKRNVESSFRKAFEIE